MSDYLDGTGLNIDALEDRIAAVKAALRSLISANFDLSTDQPSGQLVEIQCERTQSALELLRSVYSGWDPDNATGHALTALSLISGTQRRAATFGTVTLTVNLNGGTTLPAGSVAAVSGDLTNRWVTDADVVAPAGPAADYPCAATCEASGPIQALLGTITVRATLVPGWNSVTNAADAAEGLAEETDTALRRRREQELALGGSTTVDAIRAELLELVGMVSVDVFENDLDVAAAGMPPHSVWSVIWDGAGGAVANTDIAEVIFEEKAGGVRAYGYTVVTHTDEQGNTHQIGFTRAAQIAIAVEVTIPAANRGADYPGDAAVAQAIGDWADDYFAPGVDVYRSEIVGVVVALPGVENVSLCRLALAPVPPGVFAAADRLMGVAQLATIDGSPVGDVVIL